MFYLKEIFLRLKYSLLAFLFILFICYTYKNILFLIVILSILDSKDNTSFSDLNHFIYTHPTELFQTYIWLIVFLTTLFIIPYIFWQILDFLKSSLYLFEYNNLKLFLNFFFFFILILNYLGFFILFPKIWFWFENFNTITKNFNSGLNFFFELKVIDYFLFLFDFLYLLNISLILITILFFLITFLGLNNLINWKKLFIFLNIVFATLLSPPDVYTQIILLLLFTLLLEFFICILIIKLKIIKYLIFNKVTY